MNKAISRTLFCSDTHFFHKKICEYTDRKLVTTQELHDQWLIDLWNSQVNKGDLVYLLGDVSFGKLDDTISAVKQLNGQIIVIKGNHDKREDLAKLKDANLISAWYDYKEITINKQSICLFHFPIAAWHKQGYGAWHLFWHCVDDATEILTQQGWKHRDKITKGDSILSYNLENDEIESDIITDIYDVNYSGEVVYGDGKSFNFRVTADRDMVTKTHQKSSIIKMKAHEFAKRNKAGIVCSGKNSSRSVQMSSDLLKLYILIAADGSIKHETKLCRIKVRKEHKKVYIANILKTLQISNNQYNKDEYISFNFYIPEELSNWNIKGLDEKLINCSEDQADSVFEAYCNSDGHLLGNTLVIYSAKEVEIDILQAMFASNGYLTNKYSRVHRMSFSNKVQHQLSVTKKSSFVVPNISKYCNVQKVENEHFWCIKSRNSTWVMRRNGVVQITGNCHGSYNNHGLSLDVGIDSAYNYFGEHKLFTYDDVADIMKTKQFEVTDHHKDSR
jgi:calcineurin-like phosphoesterase family protein